MNLSIFGVNSDCLIAHNTLSILFVLIGYPSRSWNEDLRKVELKDGRVLESLYVFFDLVFLFIASIEMNDSFKIGSIFE